VRSTRRPRIARLVLRGMYTTARLLPRIAFNSFLKELSEPDREVAVEHGPDAIMRFFLEALRQGPEGVRLDYQLWGQNWDFAFEDVRSHVDIWQGDADELVPVHHAEDLVHRLPDATLHLLPHTGHVSIQHRIGTILDGLLGHRASYPKHGDLSQTSIQKIERRVSDGNRNP
jgi:pimeloyl-ACP methyl ester carboxylesterase